MVPFGAEAQVRWLQTLGCRAETWREEDGSLMVTDNGNCLARCWFAEGIEEEYPLAERRGSWSRGSHHTLEPMAPSPFSSLNSTALLAPAAW